MVLTLSVTHRIGCFLHHLCMILAHFPHFGLWWANCNSGYRESLLKLEFCANNYFCMSSASNSSGDRSVPAPVKQCFVLPPNSSSIPYPDFSSLAKWLVPAVTKGHQYCTSVILHCKCLHITKTEKKTNTQDVHMFCFQCEIIILKPVNMQLDWSNTVTREYLWTRSLRSWNPLGRKRPLRLSPSLTQPCQVHH